MGLLGVSFVSSLRLIQASHTSLPLVLLVNDRLVWSDDLYELKRIEYHARQKSFQPVFVKPNGEISISIYGHLALTIFIFSLRFIDCTITLFLFATF